MPQNRAVRIARPLYSGSRAAMAAALLQSAPYVSEFKLNKRCCACDCRASTGHTPVKHIRDNVCICYYNTVCHNIFGTEFCDIY